MKCYLLIVEIGQENSYLGGKFVGEKRIFAKNEQAIKAAINSFFKWLDNSKDYNLNVNAQVCHFLRETNNIPLLMKFIKKEFSYVFRFLIEEIQLEGHVMG